MYIPDTYSLSGMGRYLNRTSMGSILTDGGFYFLYIYTS